VETLSDRNKRLVAEVKESKRLAIDMAKEFAAADGKGAKGAGRSVVIPRRLTEAGPEGGSRSGSEDTVTGLEAQVAEARGRGEDDIAAQLQESVDL